MEKLIGADRAAKMLGKTKRWATDLLRSGQIKGQLVDGKYWVTTREAVEEYQRKQLSNQQGNH